MSAATEVTEAAMTLSTKERARLAEKLIKSLQGSSPPLRNASDDELVRRIKSIGDVSRLPTMKSADGVIRRAVRARR
jgi:hypothetical protein